MPDQTSAIILFASARRDGNTGKLVDQVARALSVPVIDLGQVNFSDFDYEHRNRDDEFEGVMERVLVSRDIIFASPVYWYAVAPAMKRFIDRITDYMDLPDLLEKGRQLRGKTAWIVCTSNHHEPDTAFLGALKQTADYLGMQFGGTLHMDCSDGFPGASATREIDAFVSRLQAASESAA